MTAMDNIARKQIVVVGDRVLILPDNDKETTEHGLYLPPSVKEKEKIHCGYIVKAGPGYPVPNPQYMDQESWSNSPRDPVKYIPLQVEEGDYAMFLRDQAIELEYEGKKYLIVTQNAILLVVRRNLTESLES
jgi:chaperonin GroES